MVRKARNGKLRLGCAVIMILGFCGNTGYLWATQDTQTDSEVKLRVGYAQSEDAAKVELLDVISKLRNQQDWEARASKIRDGILRGAKLTTLPERTPLNPIYSSLRTYDGYTAENVAIESSPGFFVTGTIYRPVGFQGKLAGILSAHGHAGRFDPNRQNDALFLQKWGPLFFIMT